MGRFSVAAACIAIVAVVPAAPAAARADVIRVWVVTTPPLSDAPVSTLLPVVRFRQEASRLGYDVAVESFPAIGFAAIFSAAVLANAAPDAIVFDNYLVMDGGTIAGLGRVDGIGQDALVRRSLIKVTGGFEQLLGSRRGWTYLFALSPAHAAAKAVALRSTECSASTPGAVDPDRELRRIVDDAATAYLKGDAVGVRAYSDPERLPNEPAVRQAVNIGGIRTCAISGNARLAVVSVNAAYESDTALGQARLLLVFRKSTGQQWQLLVASQDPVSNGDFAVDAPRLAATLTSSPHVQVPPTAANLLSPNDGQFPAAPSGERFGTFAWRSSTSEDVVAEIVEFGYGDDARLFLRRPARPGSRAEISAGSLWTTRRSWLWRVWSVSRTGEIAFSESRTFIH